jgi:hypothetical protein
MLKNLGIALKKMTDISNVVTNTHFKVLKYFSNTSVFLGIRIACKYQQKFCKYFSNARHFSFNVRFSRITALCTQLHGSVAALARVLRAITLSYRRSQV